MPETRGKMGETSQQSMNFHYTGLRYIGQTWSLIVYGFIVFDCSRNIIIDKNTCQAPLSRRSQRLAGRIPDAHANTAYSPHYQ